MKSLLKKLLNIALLVVESAYFDDSGNLVISVRPYRSRQRRCPHCGRKCAGYDSRGNRRRWRSLDLGFTRVYLEYDIVRVKCPEHGVHAEAVTWAHHASRFTYAFEQQVTWLCVHANRSVVSRLMRIDWKSVGAICGREYTRLDAAAGDRFENLRRIGIDETSYKKGFKYMAAVLDHDAGRIIWCAEGCSQAVLDSFFDLLGEKRCARIEVVTADGAYMLKERLRDVFKCRDVVQAREQLEAWLKSASHSWTDEIKGLSKKIRRHKERILKSVELGVSNARVESVNNKIKLSVRMAYGFRNIDNLIALIMLRCSNLPIDLPGRVN